MNSLYRDVRDIAHGTGYNQLPLRKRDEISKFLDAQEIVTGWQILNAMPEITPQLWREGMERWIRERVRDYKCIYGGTR